MGCKPQHPGRGRPLRRAGVAAELNHDQKRAQPHGHEEGDDFFLCHETPGAKLYPVVGAEGQFDVLCHPASALDDVAMDIVSLTSVILMSNMLATGPSTAEEDSYCHALGEGSLVWTLAR